jgi:hypothetical protein
VLTCIPAEGQALAQAAPYGTAPPPPPAAPVQRSLRHRTHNWLAPTGELLRSGDAEVTMHEFLYASGAVAVSDNLELNFSMPVLPLFASVGARLGLTSPASPLKLVVGFAAYMPLVADDGDELLTQATATVGYTTDRLNLHATVSLLAVSGEDKALVALNAGGSFMIGRKVALMGELVHLAVAEDDAPADEAMGLSMVGLKFMGESTDFDVGLAFPHIFEECRSDDCSDDGQLVALPAMSMTYRF